MIKNILQAFAIFATYLFICLPAARATIIHFPPYSSSNDISFSSSDYLDIDIADSQPTNNDHIITVAVKNATPQYEVKKVYIHKCGSSNPYDCISGGADIDEFDGNSEAVYHWFDCTLIDQSSNCKFGPYPQEANLFILSQVAGPGGGLFWVGSWYTIERTCFGSIGTDCYAVENHEPQQIDVYTKTSLSAVKDQIQTRKMIPINSLWIEKIVIPAVDAIFHVSTNAFSSYDSEEVAGTQIAQSEFTDAYSFLLGSDGNIVNSAFTAFLYNPSEPVCGDGVCNLGESQTTCCYDCGCAANWYCNGGTEGNCELSSGITLTLYSTQSQFVIPDCSKDNDIIVQARLNNAPSSVTDYDLSYRLDVGGQGISDECTNPQVINNVYICTVRVPATPGCEGSGYELSPNYMDLAITYDDGSQPDKTKSMSVAFGKIVQGSFTCGDGICESSLGESNSVCCYDCSCANGKYCDTATGGPPGLCRTMPSESDLDITSYSNVHFDLHNPTAGDIVTLDVEITNKPSSLNIINEECSIGCNSCSATCTVDCGPDTSTDPSVYASTCDFSFKISDYATTNDYMLPNGRITLNLQY